MSNMTSECAECGDLRVIIMDDVAQCFNCGRQPAAGNESGAKETGNAEAILKAGAKHLADRAATRDQENGERTMGQIVAAFNAIYGTDLTEVMGWQFMVLLKMARSANGRVNPDDYEDGAAYFALAGEAALRDRSKEDEA